MTFFHGFWHIIWALLGLPCGPMYPKGLYMNLDLLFHYFTNVLVKKWSLVTDSFCFCSFISLKIFMFFAYFGGVKPTLWPKVPQTSPYGLVHLNLCFGPRFSPKMDLICKFGSLFFNFSLCRFFWANFRWFFGGFGPPHVTPNFQMVPIWTPTPSFIVLL